MAWVEPPLEHVALDDQRREVRSDLTLGGALGSGTDVDEQRSPVEDLLVGGADALTAAQPA